MYERFTDRSRRVMQLANEEAQRFGHEYIGTEHLLLGLIREGDGVAAIVLNNLHVDLREVRGATEAVLSRGAGADRPVKAGKLPLTPPAKQAIAYAIEEARDLNHNYVGTEHLLLGVARHRDGVAAVLLSRTGVTYEAVRAEVMKVLDFPTPKPDESPPPQTVEPRPDEPPLPREVRQVVDDLTRRIEAVAAEKAEAIAAQDFDRAAHLREREVNLTRAKRAILREWRTGPPGRPGDATEPREGG
ncbi:MAG TPA: Clp protease N-terminal domain-containing protein [Gemmataceae bacterium]